MDWTSQKMPKPPNTSYPLLSLPRERLLDEIDVGSVLAVSDSQANLVTKSTRATDCNSHGTHLVLLLHTQEGVDVGSSREHLDSGRGAVYFLCGAWLADKEHDSENVPSLVHAQDLSHPGADPLQMLGSLNGPD